MENFDNLVDHYRSLLEAEMPPPEAGLAAPPMEGPEGGMPPPGPEEAGAMEGEQPEMDNTTKRDTDPREYTRSILSLLVNKEEGVSPEMFEDFLDSVSLAVTKVKDKPGLKEFYRDFYEKLNVVIELRDELKDKFRQMSGVVNDLVGEPSEPDDAGGGDGKAGPSGPGVK